MGLLSWITQVAQCNHKGPYKGEAGDQSEQGQCDDENRDWNDMDTGQGRLAAS